MILSCIHQYLILHSVVLMTGYPAECVEFCSHVNWLVSQKLEGEDADGDSGEKTHLSLPELESSA
jgi:hypothetical protein